MEGLDDIAPNPQRMILLAVSQAEQQRIPSFSIRIVPIRSAAVLERFAPTGEKHNY